MLALITVPFPPAYLNLCRDKPFERDFEEGDYVVYKESEDGRPAAGLYHQTPAGLYPESYSWVPRLDQLLDKLFYEEHVFDVGFYWAPAGSFDEEPKEHWCCHRNVPEFMKAEGRGTCREEAAYRLLLTLRERP